MKRKVPETMAACFDLIEREMFEGPWVLGESYSICDPYLFTVARWLDRDGVDIARFPNVADHRARLAKRPAVATVLAEGTEERRVGQECGSTCRSRWAPELEKNKTN